MVKKTFFKACLRSIRGSFSRFLAIFLIVALGAGFLAGLLATTPEYAAVSVGYNTYGHPAQETLDRLSAMNTECYRTDQMGSVTLYANRQEDG